MSLDSKVYVTNAPQNTLAGEIFSLGDVVLSIDNVPVTTVSLCSTHIKDALASKGWCKVLIERPISIMAKRRTKCALKTEKSLEMDPRLPEDVMTICNDALKVPIPSSPVPSKSILKDKKAVKSKPTNKYVYYLKGQHYIQVFRVVIADKSEEVTIGCDPYNLDLMEPVEKPDPVKNEKKKKRGFFGLNKSVDN